jgi:hypothetical protein
VTPVVVPEDPEEQSEVQEEEMPEANEVGEDLPECLDHRPSSFERGKPGAFLSWFANILLNALLN